jgi:predicted amidohydrolase YtcJ
MAHQLEPFPFDEFLSPHPPRLADLLIRAAAIYSMARHRAFYQAIAIRDEWIVAVSQDPHGLDGLIGAGTHVLDAPDLTILPAFEDTHNHLILTAQNMGLVPVDRAHTLAEFIDLIRQRAAQTPPGSWIQTSAAWHEVNLAEGRLPTAPELDEATQDHPVVVRRGGHVAIANSLALARAGITRETPDPQEGTIVRFPDGTPTGVLIEPPAYAPVVALMPAMTHEQMVEGLRQACREYNASGIGTVRDPWVAREQVPVYQALWERSELTVRSRLMLAPMAATLEERMAIIEGFGVRSGFGDDLLKLWGLKFGLDGGAEGGALDEPYVNNPGYRGHLLWNPDDLLTIITFAVRRGWKIGTHAIGDRAVRTLLDVYEQVIQENPGLKPGTLVLEHGFLADARQRARAIRLGIPVTVQHPLLYTLGSVLLDGWGEQRTREIMPVRAWLEEGASLSAGTDHPVSSFNPGLSLWGMVTRGTLKAGIQGPEYAIDQYTAVQLYTVAGAQLNGESHRRGTLEPRRLADLVAFRSNPITCPIDDLPSLRPVFTMVGGRAVYDPEFLIRMTG